MDRPLPGPEYLWPQPVLDTGPRPPRPVKGLVSGEDWSSTNSEKNTLENVSFSSERFIPKTWAKDENMMYQPECTKPTSPLAKLKHKLNVELCSRDLWKKFHALGTEMIITKAGSLMTSLVTLLIDRRMFPTVKVRLTGLDPSASYIVFLDIVAVDDKRYRYVYHSSQWMVAGSGDPSNSTNLYVHPDSPATGQLWMAQGVVAFDKLKLTNNKKPLVRGQVSLHSMHKYQPRVHIMLTTDLETQPEKQVNQQKALSFSFPETTFTTVTAYQNQQITRLKIASNPFAKGFREASRTSDSSSKLSVIEIAVIGDIRIRWHQLLELLLDARLIENRPY
uniref:T-box domain-containing protein n=1 Tax=Timema bartmani TaxID=61472 RepID=A0A7R9F3Y2_9NEOP|nr:unnamed protein product [Timema bartmani]